jgi:acyl-CoA thioester hydrolase
MKSFECKIKVRYFEVGRRGFAHHSNYFNWFDVALEELIKSCGMSYKEIEDLGYFFATLSDKCKYYHPATYGDELVVRLTVIDVSNVKVRFSYEIIREKDATLIATGESTHVFVDKSFRLHPLNKVVPKLYNVIGDMV